MRYEELIQDTTAQRTLPWHRARLGKVTGSKVSDLMGKGRSKADRWSATAKKYIASIWGERYDLDPAMVADDERFGDWLERTQKETRAMRWGTEHEDEARMMFQLLIGEDEVYGDTFGGLQMKEVGSCEHPVIEGWNSSPDGVMVDANGYMVAAVEIKCPEPSTNSYYSLAIWDAESLKKERPDYYYQCLSHMAVTGAQACFFIWYDPDAYIKCKYILVPRDEEEMATLESRVAEALAIVEARGSGLFRVA